MPIYKSIIDMLQNSIKQHTPVTEYEKGFIAGMEEAIAEIKIAESFKGIY